MLAEYDGVFSEVITLSARATNYLSPKVQNELVGLLSKSIACTAKNVPRRPWNKFLEEQGQGYDGAIFMRSIHADVLTLTKSMVDSLVSFVQCGSHKLNPVISHIVGAVTENDDFIGTLKSTFIFLLLH